MALHALSEGAASISRWYRHHAQFRHSSVFSATPGPSRNRQSAVLRNQGTHVAWNLRCREICRCVFLPDNHVRTLSRNQRFQPVANIKQFDRLQGRRFDCPNWREAAVHAWRDFKSGRAIQDWHGAGFRAACHPCVNAAGVLDQILVLCPELYYMRDSVLCSVRSVKSHQCCIGETPF